ncbi:MAG: NUDIX domain-containing protein [Candidatus Gastranaerophilales bacterium]|nr:NUDIX domain-containing protein [Candidatus Gastranaerophilales bacterium]
MYMYAETKTHEVTVDVVIFTIRDRGLEVLLVQREQEPFKDAWAIPGGFVRMTENLDEAAKRVLYERTRVQNVYLEQQYTFGDPLRHPKSRVITVSYFALIRADDIHLSFDTGLNVQNVDWHSVYELPNLAFDHDQIIKHAVRKLRDRLEATPVAFQLLPKKFTLTDLQKTYENILNNRIDKRNFRKKIMSLGFLLEHNEFSKSSSKRPARLYSFNKDVIESKKGIFI